MDVMPAFASIVAAALMAGSLVTGPAAISPGCDVTDATLSWGFKESFRAYIDGDIANGERVTADGATYSTPLFSWPAGTGRYDPATGDGYIQFAGSVRFPGHDGLLDTTIANPVVQLNGSSGAVLLDVSGPTMDGTPVDQKGVRFVAFPSLTVVGGDAVRTVDAATELTADGATAVPNYEVGEAFDPVAISMTVGKLCATALAGSDDVSDERVIGPLEIALIAFGGLAAVAAVISVFIATRRRQLRA
ncbi:hypothetical protein BH09ACT4_BH09ACT4_19200 [soil metagenome]